MDASPAVRTPQGEVAADLVVVAIDPRRLPALASYVRRTMPAIPPVVCHVGLEGEVPDLPHEVVLHGDPLLVVRTGGRAPDGAAAWTVLGRGRLAEDVLTALARRGLDVRKQVVTRVDRSPRDLVERWGGSPHGDALAGAPHGPHAARSAHADPGRPDRGGARDDRVRAALRRAQRGAGGRGRRPGVSVRPAPTRR